MTSTARSSVLTGSLCSLLVCIAAPASLRANGTGNTPDWVRRTIDGHGSITLVDQPTLDGSQSYQFMVPDDGVSYRAELATAPPAWGSYRYQFAVFLPQDWQSNDEASIVAQWHGYKLANNKDTNPPVSLAVQGDHWRLIVNHLSDPTHVESQPFMLPPIQTGVWNHFDVRIRWSHDGENGVVTLMHDGETWVNYSGVNNYEQKNPPYFNVGIYHPLWNPKKDVPYATGGAPIVVYTAGVSMAPDSTDARSRVCNGRSNADCSVRP